MILRFFFLDLKFLFPSAQFVGSVKHLTVTCMDLLNTVLNAGGV